MQPPLSSGPDAASSLFLARHKETASLNQYWYSSRTIQTLVAEALEHGAKAAFVSTPSLYCSLPEGALRRDSVVFDFDRRFARLGTAYCHFDFNEPENIPQQHRGVFDLVIIDPPFITEAVWEKYAQAIDLLLAPGGKILASTVLENAPQLLSRLKLSPNVFLPSIPTLVYQFSLFTNYTSSRLNVVNPEIAA